MSTHVVPARTLRQTRYLAQSIRLSEAETPAILRASVTILCATVFGFIVWACMASVSEIARAPGEVTPAAQSRIVQHRDGGTVAATLVRDGQMVKQGDALLRLDDSDIKQDLARAQARQTALALQEERLRALIENRSAAFAAIGDDAAKLIDDQAAYLKSQQEQRTRDLAVIDDQIKQKQAELSAASNAAAAANRNADLIARTLTSRRALHRDGVLSTVRLSETEQRHNEATAEASRLRGDASSARAALAELDSRKQALLATRDSDAHRELDAVLAQSAENRELIAKLQTRLENLLVTAPVAGMVQGLNLQLRGSVISAAQPVMEIVPTDGALAVTLRIRPADIGHLGTGQRVQVKVSSFDFARHGAATGRLQSLSPSTFEGAQGERFYEGVVTLDQPYVGNPSNRILPGMTVMADIITGDKTIMAYLLKPLQSAVATAFSER